MTRTKLETLKEKVILGQFFPLVCLAFYSTAIAFPSRIAHKDSPLITRLILSYSVENKYNTLYTLPAL